MGTQDNEPSGLARDGWPESDGGRPKWMKAPNELLICAAAESLYTIGSYQPKEPNRHVDASTDRLF